MKPIQSLARLFLCGLLLISLQAFAALTPQQLTTVKQFILSDPEMSQFVSVGQYQAVATLLNAVATPTFSVYRTNVTLKEVGDSLNGNELAGLSSLNHTRLQTVVALSQQGINSAKADRRQFFDDIFSGAGGATTRANLALLWKRPASRIEKLLATGVGSDASPATMTFEGSVSATDVEQALVQG